MARKDVSTKRPEWEHHAYEHVLSYQRRIQSVKEYFLRRNRKSPLGILKEYIDRTEAQMRGSLHAHIVCWFRKMKLTKKEYQPIPVIPRSRKNQGQRPCDESPLKTDGKCQEDDMYYKAGWDIIIITFIQ